MRGETIIGNFVFLGNHNKFMDKNTEKILQALEKNITDLFKIMKISKFEVQTEILNNSDGGRKTLSAKIKIEENPGILIGEAGRTLFSLQHILYLILLGQKIITGQDEMRLMLDINDYNKNRIDKIHLMAENYAKEVETSKEPVILDPMPAYERRLVHMELEKNSKVTTESIGEEPRRRIVIRPKEDKSLSSLI